MNPLPRILIVEDESLIALDVSRRLTKLGFEVCGIVATGEQAVTLAAELKPDLMLMDIFLRGPIDGIVAAAVIRERHDLPIVFLTANSDEKTLNRAKFAYPASYLLKPFKERELQITVEMALLNHRLQRELRLARDLLEKRVEERTRELSQANEALRVEIEFRDKMEAQTREQADLLAKARDAIYVRDLAGSISFWNCSAERLYGHLAANVMGKKAPALLGEEKDPVAQLAERETLRSGEWTGELSHITFNGGERTVESRWTLVRDEAGAPQKILVVNTDATERKKAADQFLRTQRLQSIGTLASGIAHDLNNVLAPILLASDLLAVTPEPERTRILEMVKSAAGRGADMVRQVLLFAGGGARKIEPTALDHIVQEVRGMMAATLPCSIRVSSEVPANLKLVECDATHLHQVLVNLCVNARDAMPDGGDLRIQLEEVAVNETRAREKGEIRPGQYICMSVADTGVGMTRELQEKIFEPFFTTKEIGKGTGLGLSTVASIVRAHHGFLEVESEIGRGSRFLIFLPVASSNASTSRAPLAALPTGLNQLIIVADDEHWVREITKLALEAENYRVVLASDGAEALAVFVQHQAEVALIVTDIMMPVMNGPALIRALRQHAPELPILAFSAADDSNPLVGALNNEGVELLRKPATPRQFLTAVARALHPKLFRR